ncbi:DUF4252 domain-containing protein [Flavobacterium sp. Sd200]|uniref:DUF4252 domain-containing protein n=1 Tax=Flavobacterium sp. Sd200 TaxID=2692211 RepID=UPI001368EED1|nr:DUF4252 domain-containing protein [Flavobacterium sp. Sd200]MXN90273.1 DUF4252 domain-containing protein [Flavobacterium sp. Sd200]
MKKIIIVLFLAVLPTITFAQDAFAKFEDKEGINVITVNKKMFDLLGGIETSDIDAKAKKYLKQVKNLDYLKIFTTSQINHINEMESTVSKYLKKNSLEEVMSIADKGTKVKLYVKSGKTATDVKEFLLFSNGGSKKEAVLVSFTGNVDLSDLK